MKVSKSTLDILKNFTKINGNIKFNASNKISTGFKRSVYAQANLEDMFPHEFCIHDLNQFVRLLTMDTETCEIDIDDDYVYISSYNGRSNVKYRTSSEATIFVPEIKILEDRGDNIFLSAEPQNNSQNKASHIEKIIPVISTFEMNKETRTLIDSYSSTLNTPQLKFASDGKKVFAECFDAKKSGRSFNSGKIIIGENNDIFEFVMSVENFNIIQDDYLIKITNNAILMRGKTYQVDYYIGAFSGI